MYGCVLVFVFVFVCENVCERERESGGALEIAAAGNSNSMCLLNVCVVWAFVTILK